MTNPEYLPVEVERRLAAMTEGDFDLLCARVRSPEEVSDPKVRAARAVSRAVTGRRPGQSKPTPEYAAAKLAEYRRNNS
jgi:hypothetical protein